MEIVVSLLFLSGPFLDFGQPMKLPCKQDVYVFQAGDCPPKFAYDLFWKTR